MGDAIWSLALVVCLALNGGIGIGLACTMLTTRDYRWFWIFLGFAVGCYIAAGIVFARQVAP